MSNQRWSREEGKNLVEQWQQSGLDKLTFCREHGITYSRFLYWNKQVSESKIGNNVRPGFVAITVEPENAFKGICLQGSNGLLLHVSNDLPSIQFVKALLSC
jgi:transposase-like protein